MSQNPRSDQNDLRDEYDFSGGVRGKHHEAYGKGTNVVLLDPDVAEVFKDSEAVNTALRLLLTLARDQPSRNDASNFRMQPSAARFARCGG